MKPLSAPHVLVATAPPEDVAFFSRLGHSCQWKWKLTITPSVPDAMSLVASQKFQLVVCDRELAPQWRSIITGMKASAPHSCFLLISPVSDDYLWREVLRCGGYDVIPRPLDAESVNRILEQAWHYCNAVPPDLPG